MAEFLHQVLPGYHQAESDQDGVIKAVVHGANSQCKICGMGATLCCKATSCLLSFHVSRAVEVGCNLAIPSYLQYA